MSMITDFRALVLADTDVAALVGTRMDPHIMEQNPTLPYLTYFQVDAPRDYTHDGQSNWVPARIQIDAWAATFIGARALAEKVRLALSGRTVKQGSTKFYAIELDGDGDLHSSELESQQEGLFRVSMDFIVRYEEAIP